MVDDHEITRKLLDMASEAEQGAIKSFERSSGAEVRLAEERCYIDHAIAFLDLAERARRLVAMRAPERQEKAGKFPTRFPSEDLT